MSSEYVFITTRTFCISNNVVFHIANNHAGDLGPEGLATTIKHLRRLGVIHGAHEKVHGNSGIILKIMTGQGIVRSKKKKRKNFFILSKLKIFLKLGWNCELDGSNE